MTNQDHLSSSVQNLWGRLESVKSSITHLEVSFLDVVSDNSTLKRQVDSLKHEIAELNDIINDYKQNNHLKQ